MKRWQVTTLGIIGVAALVTSGCGHINLTTEQHTYQITDRVDRLVINEHDGPIEITVGDGPVSVTEELRFSANRPKTTRTASDGTLTLADRGCSSHWGHCEVGYRVRVPASTALDIHADAGSVTVTGLAGDIRVASDAGTIRGTRLTSQHTSITSDAGAIRLAYTTGPSTVDVRTDAGAIDIRVPGGTPYAVQTSTDAGKSTVTVPTDAASAHHITARTDAGAILVHAAS